MNYEMEYLKLCHRILDHGIPVTNDRTGKTCYTILNKSFIYTAPPILTVRPSAPIAAAAEMLGYLRGYTWANQFDAIGAKTWYANANENRSWLDNPHRKGVNHMGRVYGAVGRDFGGVDLLTKVYDNLRQGIDDRGEILTFWKPDEFDRGCLRPCMHSHQFSVLGDTLHLTSYERSCDVGNGLNFNSIQCWFLLNLMAQITGLKPGTATHHITNLHIYEDQVPAFREMLNREPLWNRAEVLLNPEIKTLSDVLEHRHARDYLTVSGYESHPKIIFPFSA